MLCHILYVQLGISTFITLHSGLDTTGSSCSSLDPLLLLSVTFSLHPSCLQLENILLLQLHIGNATLKQVTSLPTSGCRLLCCMYFGLAYTRLFNIQRHIAQRHTSQPQQLRESNTLDEDEAAELREEAKDSLPECND